jgi:hypothetical protein
MFLDAALTRISQLETEGDPDDLTAIMQIRSHGSCAPLTTLRLREIG